MFLALRRIAGVERLAATVGAALFTLWSGYWLAAGHTHKYQIAGEETVLVLQEGQGTFVTPDGTWNLSRSNVFDVPLVRSRTAIC